MSDGQDKKRRFWKNFDSISHITQHFFYTKFSSIEDHNQTKQSYTKVPNTYFPYTNSIHIIHSLIPYLDFFFFLSSSLFFLLLLFFLFSLSHSSLLHLVCLNPKAKMRYFVRPCLVLSTYSQKSIILLFGPSTLYYL